MHNGQMAPGEASAEVLPPRPAAARAEEAPLAYQSGIKAAGLNQAQMAVSAVRAKEPGVIVFATGDDMLGFNHHRFDYLEWLGARS